MIHSLLNFLQTTFTHLGPLGVFLGSFLGEIIAPIPAVSMISGASFSIVRHAHFSLKLLGDILILIALPDAFGATLGSFVTYGIGYWGGKPVISRWGKYFGISWKSVEKVHDRLATTTKDEWFLFLIRAIPLLPNLAVNIVCGIVQVPKARYALVTFWGIIVRAFIYGFIGWSLGGAYRQYAHLANRLERQVFILIAIAVVSFVIWRIYKSKRNNKSDTI